VGCTKNCPDLKPATAHRNSLADLDRTRGRQRAVFAGLLPGLILAFYTVGEATDLPARALYFGGLLLWSLGAFALLEAVVRLSLEKLVTLFGAFSLTMFYWFNVPTMVNGVGRLLEVSPPASVSWIGRENVLLLSIVFVVRTFTKDRAARSSGSANTQAREHARKASARESTAPTGPAPEAGPGPQPVTLQKGGPNGLERRSPARRMRLATVTALPRGHSTQVRPGSTLLDCAEQLGLSLEPAPGVGDYAIFVVTGMENLSPPERDECATLERLGLEGRARLASSAHVQADVTISLEAPLEQAPPSRVAMGGRGAGIARAFQDDSR
jgi:ferredoxin